MNNYPERSLPDPGSEGDVLTVHNGDWQSRAASGGGGSSFTILPVASGGTGIGKLPPANALLGVNDSGTAYEGISIEAGNGITLNQTGSSVIITNDAALPLGVTVDPWRRDGFVQIRGSFNADLITHANQSVQVGNMGSCQQLGGYQGWNQTTTNISGSSWYIQDSAAPNLFTYAQKPAVHFITAPVDITNVRIWFGAFSTLPFDLDDQSAGSVQGAGLRYSTVAGDTTWKFVTYDGAAGNLLDTGVTVAANTPIHWYIDMMTSSSQINCYADNVLVASSNLHLPNTTQNLSWTMRGYTQETVVKTMWFGRVYWEAQ